MALKPIEEQQLTKKYLELSKKMALNSIMLMQDCMFIRCLSKNSYFFVEKFSLILLQIVIYYSLQNYLNKNIPIPWKIPKGT